MKAAKGSLAGALDRPDAKCRFYLFYGPDDSQSRGHGERLLAGLGGAAKAVIAAAALKSDPAALADEASAISLFGEPRALWIDPAGEDILAAVEALFAAPAVESPVVAIGGALRKSSALLKLAEAHPLALAHASYELEGRDAEQMVVEIARGHGLRCAPGVAARIAGAAGNDRAIVAQELAKLALYKDAAPERPGELGHDALDAVGADMAEGDVTRLSDLALGGDLAALADELARLSSGGTEAIPVVRAVQRRLLMLAPMRARVESGERPDAVMTSLGKSLFWKDKPLLTRLLASWDAKGLATVAERAGKLERDLMLTPAPVTAALGEELTAIARAARRR
ncbi:DNA polymerase III subunit delta [Sphingomonas sp.]|uniref:DNA polymerase III subunit delta n=1 Tax=Sphingomonas sp. TaxID=28214 RepID=UPI00286E1AC7|nr:DNA polymerase III subunit delta [Sphingomonas sp.]